MIGPELLGELRRRGVVISATLITSGPTVGMAQLDKTDARLVEKPFRPGELIICIETTAGRGWAE
jgi:hypothetical protein